MRKTRAMILTQPLGHNYGGLLQAYALQRVLQDFNLDVHVFGVGPRMRRLRRAAAMINTARRSLSRKPRTMGDVQQLRTRPLREFRDDHIRYAMLRKTKTLSKSFEVFVVGSDQVWRPEYSDVSTCLFSFLPSDFQGRRISYAASFGIEAPREYSEALVDLTRPFAHRLDAISVREDSGVGMVRALWGREDAVQHVDPTLLLKRAEWEMLASGERAPGVPSGGVVTILLDDSSPAAAFAHRASDAEGTVVHTLMRPKPISVSDYLADPAEYELLSVGAWLRGIREANIVVTDSFHAVVFSILFNTPFLISLNRERGAARLESFLRGMGLYDLIVPDEALGAGSVRTMLSTARGIDWRSLDHWIEEARQSGLEYLRSHLGGSA